MSKVWVVFGTTGEYSDHREWPVCAFTTEQGAQRRVTLCDEEYRRIVSDPEWATKRYSFDGFGNKYDPDMMTDYTGTRYYYYEMELHDE